VYKAIIYSENLD